MVVGAGVAGVSAAATLLEHNVDDNVILLEASDRIGGRIHTVQYGLYFFILIYFLCEVGNVKSFLPR